MGNKPPILYGNYTAASTANLPARQKLSGSVYLGVGSILVGGGGMLCGAFFWNGGVFVTGVVAGVTLVLYVIINFKILDRYFQENFQCNTVKDLHADKIEYLTDNKIFSMTPSNVLSKCPDSNLYAHENKYPFNIGNMSDTLGHMENLIEEENPEFNSTESPNMNLLVVDLNGRDSDLKTVL